MVVLKAVSTTNPSLQCQSLGAPCSERRREAFLRSLSREFRAPLEIIVPKSRPFGGERGATGISSEQDILNEWILIAHRNEVYGSQGKFMDSNHWPTLSAQIIPPIDPSQQDCGVQKGWSTAKLRQWYVDPCLVAVPQNGAVTQAHCLLNHIIQTNLRHTTSRWSWITRRLCGEYVYPGGEELWMSTKIESTHSDVEGRMPIRGNAEKDRVGSPPRARRTWRQVKVAKRLLKLYTSSSRPPNDSNIRQTHTFPPTCLNDLGQRVSGYLWAVNTFAGAAERVRQEVHGGLM